MENELISVIIPVYNVDRYLKQCIQSVTSQTYTNLEIIIINDGSSDNCSKICDEWAKKDSRINVIHKENQGLCAARNDGLRICKGEYISFIDSDDYADVKMIEQLYVAAKENKADISACFECAFEDGEQPVIQPLSFDNIKIENRDEFLENFNCDFRGHVTWVWNKLFRRDCIENVFFNEKINKLEDIIFMTDIAMKMNKCVWIPKRLYFYRQHSKSTMHVMDDYLMECYMNAIQFEYNCLKEYGSSDFKINHLKKCLNMDLELFRKCKKNKMSKQASLCKTAYNKLYDENNRKLTFDMDKFKYILCRYLLM